MVSCTEFSKTERPLEMTGGLSYAFLAGEKMFDTGQNFVHNNDMRLNKISFRSDNHEKGL
jgi:hypothetical protein